MGDFRNKLRPSLTALIAVLLLAGPAAADPRGPANGLAAPAGPESAGRDRAVSTPPESATTASAADVPARRDARPVALPLTRAAARRRVEGMSPITWLARYGAVTAAGAD